MFALLVYESFRRQTRRKMLVAIAVTFGAAVSTAMIGIATGIGDKISHEFRSYGANLVVTPDEDALDVQIGSVNLRPATGGAYLDEAALLQIKGIFWGNNIAGLVMIQDDESCLDGIDKEYITRNRGSENIDCYLLAQAAYAGISA